MTVYRGGSTPWDRDDWDVWAGRFGAHEMPILYAHTSRALVGREYATESYAGSTRIHVLRIDISRCLDARTTDGLALWRSIRGDERKAAELGYSGAIYPDPHDWPRPCRGYEVAIWDPDIIHYPFRPAAGQ